MKNDIHYGLMHLLSSEPYGPDSTGLIWRIISSLHGLLMVVYTSLAYADMLKMSKVVLKPLGVTEGFNKCNIQYTS